uniref:Leucine carboxyl methyltransferase 1 n=1 Tax=Lygus hesperus TaxID=30085 RepID=A0A0A9YZU6_LYGHE
MSSDEAVQSTNDDASECKRSAVRLGYWQDEYIQILVRHSEKKPPEINRGYFARTEGVNLFIRKFLKVSGDKCQIISFGAGYALFSGVCGKHSSKLKTSLKLTSPRSQPGNVTQSNAAKFSWTD